MKKVFYQKFIGILILLAIIILGNNKVQSCELSFSLVGEKKQKYNIGDELIVQVNVLLTHRNCPEGIMKTNFNTDGIEIIQATKWNETSTLTYVRKLKIKITGTKNGQVSISAKRTCDKEGGFAKLTLSAQPLKK